MNLVEKIGKQPTKEDKEIRLSRVPKRLFTLEEAGKYLGRTTWGVREMIYSGKIPCVRVDYRIMLDIRDLDKLIEQSKVHYTD